MIKLLSTMVAFSVPYASFTMSNADDYVVPKVIPPAPARCNDAACTVPGVQYFYQFNNQSVGDSTPYNTCQITSLAMVISQYQLISPSLFYGFREQAKAPDEAAAILKKWLGYGWWTQTGTRDQLRGLIRSGRTAMLNGYFTAGGHVVLIKGFTDDGRWVVNDPAGTWSGITAGGYPNEGQEDSRAGEGQVYDLTDGTIGADGDIWFATGDVRPINLGYGNPL